MSICQHMWFSKGPFPMSVVEGEGGGGKGGEGAYGKPRAKGFSQKY